MYWMKPLIGFITFVVAFFYLPSTSSHTVLRKQIFEGIKVGAARKLWSKSSAFFDELFDG